MATKKQFLEMYKTELQNYYPWAKDEVKLKRFMESVSNTLNGANTWNRSGEVYETTLKSLGLPKNISLKKLQQLPNE